MAYDVTISQAGVDAPALGWSTYWDKAAGLGDWRVAPATDKANPRGLDASGQIASAVVLSLFTDRRAPEGWRPDVADRRGWWGDAVAPDGEEPEAYGSLLWTLKNERVLPQIATLARAYAEEALAWMLRDRVASRVVVTTGVIAEPDRGIWLAVEIYGRSGALTYDARFARLWREV